MPRRTKSSRNIVRPSINPPINCKPTSLVCRHLLRLPSPANGLRRIGRRKNLTIWNPVARMRDDVVDRDGGDYPARLEGERRRRRLEFNRKNSRIEEGPPSMLITCWLNALVANHELASRLHCRQRQSDRWRRFQILAASRWRRANGMLAMHDQECGTRNGRRPTRRNHQWKPRQRLG